MNPVLLLRLHRWILLLLAVPLAVIMVTGLILAFQPILQTSGIKPGSISQERIEAFLDRFDPAGRARSLRIDHFAGTLTIQTGGGGPVTVVLETGEVSAERGPIGNLLSWARSAHEHFVFDLERVTGIPVVLASTLGMLVAMLIGALMGLPRFRNTVAGWHKATAWVLLPLLVLSPLTGVLMALRITFNVPPSRSEAVTLQEAVQMISRKHDLSGLQAIRTRGGQQMATVIDGSSHLAYIVARDGLRSAPVNWPRTFHQGDYFGIWGGVINVVLSLAFLLLLATGLWPWTIRQLMRRGRSARRNAAGASAGRSQA